MYLRLNEWMDIIGNDVSEQSDCMWTCRIRRYLIQSLFIIEDLYLNMSKNGFKIQPESNNDNYAALALEYIHVNYQENITLDKLSEITNLNRTSLNKYFKNITGRTLID